ncbi:MAG: BRO family protein [Cetobacterium sp.]
MSIINNENKFNAENLEHLNKILTYNNKSVRVFGTNEDPWFCGRDVCEILKYENYRKALFDNVEDDNKKNLKVLCVQFKLTPKITHNEGQMCYINKNGLNQLLLKSKTVNPSTLKGFLRLPFIKNLNLNMNIKHIFKEQDCIGAIIDAYYDYKCYKQFQVGSYYIDLYIPEHNLAIECDEHDHKERNAEYEKERQKYIENKLKCQFFRFDPDSKKFNIYKLVRNVGDFLKQTELQKLNKEIERLRKEIERLRIENKFLDSFYNSVNYPRSDNEEIDSLP